METKRTSPEGQYDEKIVAAVARAMCGHDRPCRYHVAQARLAIPAYRLALGREVLDLPVSRLGADDDLVMIPHEGIVR